MAAKASGSTESIPDLELPNKPRIATIECLQVLVGAFVCRASAACATMAAMFRYADDTSAWEGWQLGYRFGAFYIFPPSGVIEPVDALRQTHAPKSASICQAHISLSEPLAAALSDEHLHEIRATLSAVQPFDLRYGPLRSFPPYPGVCYSITPEDPFRALRAALHSTSAFAGVPLRHEHIAPHMTVAEFITSQQTHDLLQELGGKVPEGAFRCSSIEYAVPNDSFYFERVLSIPLDG